MKEEYKTPILGVIESSIKLALKNKDIQTIGLLGTSTTVNSKAYEKQLLLYSNQVKLFSTACPLFVPLVEEGWINKNTNIISKIAQEYIKALFQQNKKIDSIILGCTHYPILLKQIKCAISSLGYNADSISFIDNGAAILEDLHKCFFIKDSGLYSNDELLRVLDIEDEFYVTDLQPNFIDLANNILHSKQNIKTINTNPQILSL